jgi:hypothetical protein
MPDNYRNLQGAAAAAIYIQANNVFIDYYVSALFFLLLLEECQRGDVSREMHQQKGKKEIVKKSALKNALCRERRENECLVITFHALSRFIVVI